MKDDRWKQQEVNFSRNNFSQIFRTKTPKKPTVLAKITAYRISGQHQQNYTETLQNSSSRTARVVCCHRSILTARKKISSLKGSACSIIIIVRSQQQYQKSDRLEAREEGNGK